MTLGVPEAEIKVLGIGAEAPSLEMEMTAGDKPLAPRGRKNRRRK